MAKPTETSKKGKAMSSEKREGGGRKRKKEEGGRRKVNSFIHSRVVFGTPEAQVLSRVIRRVLSSGSHSVPVTI